MFTGIVTAVGKVAQQDGGACRIACPPGWLAGAAVGDSIAVNGACLTITHLEDDSFGCTLSEETRRCCAPLAADGRVNLERALAAAGRLDGHIVSGHVDSTARITARTKDADGGIALRVAPPPALLPLIAVKGSVALAGVSLTVNALADDEFEVYLLPHTLAHTTLADYPEGSVINIEADILARHVARLLGKALPG